MQVKIGCDIVGIDRIERLYRKLGERFLDEFLTAFEKQFLRKTSDGTYLPQSIAGFYAIKEAGAKALDCGICAQCGFKDMSIIKDTLGSVYLIYSARVADGFGLRASGADILGGALDSSDAVSISGADTTSAQNGANTKKAADIKQNADIKSTANTQKAAQTISALQQTKFSNADFSLDGFDAFKDGRLVSASISHDAGVAMAVVSFLKGI